jgi:pSer/pThr/pTyr-binding forkhead associated (FHA) protein
MFSAEYRRGLQAEAAGDYAEAARAYALAGERAKVGEMHLLRAERAPTPDGKLHELKAAIRWADLDDSEGREVRRRIARGLMGWAKAQGLVTEGDREVVREAAALFAEIGDHAGAGACHELVGEELQAAEAYQRAGEVDRLERVLDREETRRKRSLRATETFEEYRLALAAGEPEAARASLVACVEAAAPAERNDYRRLLDELDARLITDGSVTLRRDGGETRYVGALPLAIGREPPCALRLRDAGVSRRHAEVIAGDGGFQLCDLGSRNGTTLAGVRIGDRLPLKGTGELGFGEHCLVRFSLLTTADTTPTIELVVVRGVDRGLRVLASTGPMIVDGFGRLGFTNGRPRLDAEQPIRLNGQTAGARIQLARADVVELEGRRLEVV